MALLLQRMDVFLCAMRSTGNVYNMGDVASLDNKLFRLIDAVHSDGDRRIPTELDEVHVTLIRWFGDIATGNRVRDRYHSQHVTLKQAMANLGQQLAAITAAHAEAEQQNDASDTDTEDPRRRNSHVGAGP